jgi:hypothetical protein
VREAIPASLYSFHNLHAGETCLLVGNGLNLTNTPPELFEYPSFGMNTTHLYRGWEPTYYVAVDSRIMREFGEAVLDRFGHLPKFIPTPNLDKWQGDNFYRWFHRPGPLWPRVQGVSFPADILSKTGITYGNVMHAAMQIARFMGFSTMLIIGMEHGKNPRAHFWGEDEGMNGAVPVDDWISAYQILREGMGVTMLNLSVGTCVPESVIPRDDWHTWIKAK